MLKELVPRRRFVAGLGLAGLGLAALPACTGSRTANAEPGTQAAGEGHGATAGASTAEEMDRHHAERMRAFPAKTEGLGGQPLAFRMEGDVKVFELTAQPVQWELEPGVRKEAWGYNGVVPGPEIRVTEGDRVRILFRNDLPESSSIHWHGLVTPNAMDGVPYVTQEPVKPGGTFTYEFVALPAGSHMYHSHHNAAEQVAKGLLGAFIVEPRDPAARPVVDHEYTLILNDGPLGFTLNGKGFPATQALTARLGERVLIRFMNAGTLHHPMHLHGMPMEVVARDGWPLPQPYKCDTIDLAPGTRVDVVVTCDNPGVWAFHCHVLPHAESRAGMFGMVTALIVEG